MEAASNAISNILKRAGQADTTTDETVAPAVQNEIRTKKHHEKEQEVVEKEKHQDHYHTTLQPLKDNEVKATKHEHKQAATQERNFEHDDLKKTKARVDQDQSAFKNTTREGSTVQSASKADKIEGEHVHHHVHETIQPVIEKETIIPSVTHKTVPIKETHHEASMHHGTTRNEPISINEYKRKLEGEVTRPVDVYEGSPRVNSPQIKT